MAKKATKNEKKIIKFAIEIIIAVLFVLSIFKVSSIGIFINNIITFVLGDFFLIYFIIGFALYFKKYVLKNKRKLRFTIVLSIVLLCIAFLLANAIHYYKNYHEIINYSNFKALGPVFGGLKKLFDKNAVYYGGLIGVFIFSLFYLLLNYIGTLIICILLFVLSVFVIVPLEKYKEFNKGLHKFFHNARLGIKSIILKGYRKDKKISRKHVQKQENSDLEVVFEESQEVSVQQEDNIEEVQQEIEKEETKKRKRRKYLR